MRRTGDQFLVKEINTSIVLDTILKNQPLSRASISSMTGLNKGTVSSLVQELIDSHLVFETGTGESSGGRKPVLLQFQASSGHAIGVDIGVNYIQTILTDLNGRIVSELTVPHRNESEQAVIDLLHASIDHLIRVAPSSPHGIVGIGAGIPGIVNADGKVLFAPNLGWRNFALSDLLGKHYQLPLYVDNEANAGAIGELHYGAGKNSSDLIYISAGIGIGSGIIIKSDIYRGSTGYSGEIGHLTIDAHGKLCSCGNRGCWELYASEKALLALADRTPAFANEQASLEAVIKLAQLGDADTLNILTAVGQYLGIGIAGVINTLNPNRIIIGNRLTKAAPWLKPSLINEVEARCLSFHRQAVDIQFSELGIHSTALGAAYMAVSEFLRETTSTSKNTVG